MSLDTERREDVRSALERGFYIKRAYFEALKLNYTEAAVYALIRSFSDNHSEGFSGSREYLCSLVGMSERSISRALAALVGRGLVERRVIRVNGTPRPAYFADGSLESSLVEQYIAAHTSSANAATAKGSTSAAKAATAAKAPAASELSAPARQSSDHRQTEPTRQSAARQSGADRQNAPYRPRDADRRAAPYRQSGKAYERGERLNTPTRQSSDHRQTEPYRQNSDHRQNAPYRPRDADRRAEPYRPSAVEPEHKVKYSSTTAEEMFRRAITRSYEEI